MRKAQRLLSHSLPPSIPSRDPVGSIEKLILQTNNAANHHLPAKYLDAFRQGCRHEDNRQWGKATECFNQALMALPLDNTQERSFIQQQIDRAKEAQNNHSHSSSFWSSRTVVVVMGVTATGYSLNLSK